MRHLSKLPTTILLAGLILGVAAGCGGASAAKQPATTAPPPRVSSSSTTPSATTTTVAAAPETSGTDLVTVMKNLDLLQNIAYERVDFSLLDVIYTSDSEQRAIVENQLRNLRDNGLHYAEDGVRSTVTDIKATTPLDGVAVVNLISEQGPQVVKDATGKVVNTGEGWPPRRERYGLFRGVDGRWRIRDYSLLGPA